MKFFLHLASILFASILLTVTAFAVTVTEWNSSNDTWNTYVLNGTDYAYCTSQNGTIIYTVFNQNGTNDTMTARNNGSNPTGDDLKLEKGVIEFSGTGWTETIYLSETGSTWNTSPTSIQTGSGKFNLQAVLSKGNGSTIRLQVDFDTGTYDVYGPFRLFSYTTLNGVSSKSSIIRKNSPRHPFLNTDDSVSTKPAYEGAYGIHVTNLGFDMNRYSAEFFKFTHAAFYTVENCEFKNAQPGHVIEINAMRDVFVEGCTFTDIIYAPVPNGQSDTRLTYTNIPTLLGKPPYNYEIIQIEGDSNARSKTNSDKFGYDIPVGRGSFPAAVICHDNTVSKNIYIKNNRFITGIRAVGHHYFNATNGGAYQTNVTISDNYMEDMKDHAIYLQGFKNAIITGNIFYKISNSDLGGQRIYLKQCVTSSGGRYVIDTLAKDNYYINSKGVKTLLTQNASDQRIIIV